MPNKIIPYNLKLKEFAGLLRKNSTLTEVLLWNRIKRQAFGVEFHRQVPLLEYIVDFYGHELLLAIEIDGNSHDFKYDAYDIRQKKLENKEVRFLRFTDSEVKQEMFSVLLKLEQTIADLKIHP